MASTNLTDYRRMYDALRGRQHYTEAFSEVLCKMTEDFDFSWAERCVAVGPGTGAAELPLIRQCLPRIQKLAALECDEPSAVELREKLKSHFPNVDSVVHQVKVQEFRPPRDPIDVVLLFHVLYYLNKPERKSLFEDLYSRWLSNRGVVMVLTGCHTLSESSYFRLFSKLGKPLPGQFEEVREELVAAGFQLVRAYELKSECNMEKPDDEFCKFIRYHVDESVSLDEVRQVIEDLFPPGKPCDAHYALAVFKRTESK